VKRNPKELKSIIVRISNEIKEDMNKNLNYKRIQIKNEIKKTMHNRKEAVIKYTEKI
jgi:hypothetical protein